MVTMSDAPDLSLTSLLNTYSCPCSCPCRAPQSIDPVKRISTVLDGKTKLAQLPASLFQNGYSHTINQVHKVGEARVLPKHLCFSSLAHCPGSPCHEYRIKAPVCSCSDQVRPPQLVACASNTPPRAA